MCRLACLRCSTVFWVLKKRVYGFGQALRLVYCSNRTSALLRQLEHLDQPFSAFYHILPFYYCICILHRHLFCCNVCFSVNNLFASSFLLRLWWVDYWHLWWWLYYVLLAWWLQNQQKKQRINQKVRYYIYTSREARRRLPG